MSDATRLRAQRSAAEYLRQLLLKPGRYRDAWQRHVARPRDNVIIQLAVAEVIASYLRAAPRRPGDSQTTPYQLRDLVSGALSGGQLSTTVLDLFVEAFAFSDDEAGRLRRLLAGSSRIEVMLGTRAVPIAAEQDVEVALGPRPYHTLSLHHHMSVAADGRIDRARIMQVIEATAPAVDKIAFLCDANLLTLEVGQGCKELTGEIHQISADVFATDILLTRSLDVGETSTFEYTLSYRYPGDPTDASEREHRRAVMRQVDNLDMRVEFHPEKLPVEVWWANWEGMDGVILDQEKVTLDTQHSVHRYVRSLEKTVVGFHWSWE